MRFTTEQRSDGSWVIYDTHKSEICFAARSCDQTLTEQWAATFNAAYAMLREQANATFPRLPSEHRMRPNLANRLRAAQQTGQAQIQRTQTAPVSLEAAKRREERLAFVAARRLRIAARRAEEQAREKARSS